MSEDQEEYEETEDTLVEQLEAYLNQSQSTGKEHTKNILNFQQGLFQLSVDEIGIEQQFRLRVTQESGKQYLYNTSHNGPMNFNNYPELEPLTSEELEADINKESAEIDYKLIHSGIQKEVVKRELETLLSTKSTEIFNLSTVNQFSTGFQFNVLNNELSGLNSEMISPIFKNFSSEATFNNNMYQIAEKNSSNDDSEQNYKKDKFLPYNDVTSIENDFLDIARQIDTFCSSSIRLKYDHKLPKTKNSIDHIIDPNLFSIYGKTLAQIDNTVKANEQEASNESLFDADKAFKAPVSQFESDAVRENKSIITNNKKKAMSEIINNASKRLLFLEAEDIPVLESSLPTSLNVDPSKQFNTIVLQNTQGQEEKVKANQWAVEDNQEVNTFQDRIPKEKMAIQYPFELDNFQKRSILRLEEGSNVFVSAHTSAGKTVVAEYSIALAKKHKRKAIYTSPIKALSNQKYRDFKEKFGDDVGIITGDVSLNPTASCLIVTTEVLRNMLYKGHDIVRDIAWVIFDEVHYVNNQERGVVWEETIILLPESIGLVMLSATVPNYMDFANWVGRTKQRKIYVERTLNRPVPLEHSIYYEGQTFVLKSTDEQFIQQNYDNVIKFSKDQEKKKQQVVYKKQELKYEKKEKEIYKNTNQSQSAKSRQKILNETHIKMTNKQNANTGSGNGGSTFGAQADSKQIKALLKDCQKKDLLPCVVFVFSKNMIKNLSESLGNLQLITHEESKRIEEFFNRAARKLKPRDLEVHQIKTLKALMMKGIAVHHGDVIPFIKEVVEILFSQGLIKVLFATETFSMGINMPTKTVIFFAVKKFDSQELRMLNSSEYTQMSGRAGRRGLDLKGNVIILITELKKLPTRQDLFKMMDNKGEMLSSKFKVNYELILKLISSREIDVTEMIKKSYSENDKFSKLPLNLKKTEEVQKKLRDQPQIVCSLKQLTDEVIPIEEYYIVSKQIPEANTKYWKSETSYLQNELQLPCYCEFMDSRYTTYFGMVVQCIRQPSYQRYIVVMYIYQDSALQEKPLFLLEESNFFKDNSYQPFQIKTKNSKQYICELIELPTSYITKIFDEGLNNIKTDLRNNRYKNDCAFGIVNKLESYEKYRRIKNKINKKNKTNAELIIMDRLPVLNTETPQIDLLIKQNLTELYENSLCNNCPQRQDHFNKIQTREQYQNELDELMKTLDEDDLVQQKNFQARLRLLNELGYTDEENLPLLKARLAKELENIYVSEIIVRGILDELDEAELAAILMCFVAQVSKKGVQQYDPLNDDDFNYSERFIDRFTRTVQTVNSIVQEELKQEILIAAKPEDLVADMFCTELLKVAYEWVKGKDFLYVSQITEVQEGTIIRSMLRLDNLMKNIKNCVQYIGNNTLALKIESCQEKMRRDIIFAQSLYLEEDNK